ncbi:MAG: insulinase family protein, partial [Prevotella sp.]|nr:insulinase family protein [Prevotella sp.]
MKMRKLFVTLLLTIVGTMSMLAQMGMPSIPNDPDVRVGKLDNGLTYYIRHNNWPENRAEFYIAQKVGSIQENDDQRGLAHFLEHMAFNGSKHFKGNELLRWCESVGVKFGTDLNAYTSIDQTVYNISNVPTSRESIIDSCLLILYDWADGLLLEQEEIEKERGVIHEEWRLRTSAQMRMLERDLPKLYPGSKY